jgi:hypothetical protein
MPGKFSMSELRPMIGAEALDVDGNKVGDIEGVFVDKDSREPEWIRLKSSGLLGSKQVVVPLEGAVKTEKGLRIPYPKEQIKDAPGVGAEEITKNEEARIYNHFGLQYSHEPSATGLPGGARQQESGTSQASTPQSSGADVQRTRSGEEPGAGKRETDAGQVRLRRYVETEVRREHIEEEKQ